VHVVAKFCRFFGCSPDKLDLEGSGANFSKTTTSWNIRNHEAVFRAIP
jgi:hypothetical protein